MQESPAAEVNAKPSEKAPYLSRCGKRNVNGFGQNIEGLEEDESKFGEWPGSCALMRSTMNICGASLIAPGVVLTSAVCVNRDKNNVSSLRVRCGEWDIKNDKELGVAAIEIHPGYDSDNYYANDFAVIFMDGEFSAKK